MANKSKLINEQQDVVVTQLPCEWTLTCTSQPSGAPQMIGNEIAATVPGCVHTDLLSSNLIHDPYLDCNESAVQWVSHCDWRYETKFDAQLFAGRSHELVFHGLDTAATVYLNGQEILKSQNMHRTYRVDVGKQLADGENTICVDFQSPISFGEELKQKFEPRPNCYPGQGNLMRKMACNYGWDWGPTLTTAGIWKPIELVTWSSAKLRDVQTDVNVVGANGVIKLKVEVEGSVDNLSLDLSVGEWSAKCKLDQGRGELELEVPNPILWWPHGMGNQHLYELNVTLSSGEQLLDSKTQRIGFRSIDLDTSSDEAGSEFKFAINNLPLFICGANWIPDDCFPSRLTRDRLERRIAQAKDANINMLRVWGGGMFESDDFYELCDEAGILVWQDFLFACATYPEEGHLPAEIEAEVRDNIPRLMSHPSLAIWCGNNENIWGFQDWGWQDALEGRTWGEHYYLNLLPKLVAELHPSGNYYPGSPYSGSMNLAANADEHGCRHVWDVWNDVGYEVFANYKPRFVSEFGWQAPATMATIQGSVSDNPLTSTSPGVLHHQKASNGNLKLERGLAGHLPVPESFDDWHWAMQLNQARAIKFGINHYRSLQPHCMGTIVWQLNDCWPATSWAAVDGAERKKPLWYALKHAYARTALTIQASEGGLRVHTINDNNLAYRVAVSVTRYSLDGEVLAEHSSWRELATRNNPAILDVPGEVATSDNPRDEVIVARGDHCEAFYFFVEDLDLKLPKAEFNLDIAHTESEVLVTVTAQSFLKDLCIFADRISSDAEVDDMLVTLLPQQSRTFTIIGVKSLTEAELRKVGVIRTANDLVVS